MDITVDQHSINNGVSQPALSTIFRSKDVVSLSIVVPRSEAHHTHFVAYVGRPRKVKGTLDDTEDFNGFEIVVFRHYPPSLVAKAFREEDLDDETLQSMLSM